MIIRNNYKYVLCIILQHFFSIAIHKRVLVPHSIHAVCGFRRSALLGTRRNGASIPSPPQPDVDAAVYAVQNCAGRPDQYEVVPALWSFGYTESGGKIFGAKVWEDGAQTLGLHSKYIPTKAKTCSNRF